MKLTREHFLVKIDLFETTLSPYLPPNPVSYPKSNPNLTTLPLPQPEPYSLKPYDPKP